MSVEHLALHIGALCVLTVIVGIVAIAAKPETVSEKFATSPRQLKKLKFG